MEPEVQDDPFMAPALAAANEMAEADGKGDVSVPSRAAPVRQLRECQHAEPGRIAARPQHALAMVRDIIRAQSCLTDPDRRALPTWRLRVAIAGTSMAANGARP